MRLVLCVCLLSLSLGAWANLTCVNPTTGFFFFKGQSDYQLIVNSSYGAKFTPIFDGQVPPIALKQMAIDAEEVKALGQLLKTSFSDCIAKENFVSCKEGNLTTEEGLVIPHVRFYSTIVSEKSLIADYNYIKLILVFSYNGKQYQVSSRYDQKTCAIN